MFPDNSGSYWLWDWLPRWLSVKNLLANAGDVGLIPGLGRFPGRGHGNPLQYSCLENAMDKGAWWVIVHGFEKSQIWLSDYTTTKTSDRSAVRTKITHSSSLSLNIISVVWDPFPHPSPHLQVQTGWCFFPVLSRLSKSALSHRT